MTSRGFKWRRAANELAKALWLQGEKANAHLLFREVIKDARRESKRQPDIEEGGRDGF